MYTAAIIDQDPLARIIFREILKDNGSGRDIKVVWDAATYEETIPKMERLAPDIIIVGSTECDRSLLRFVESVSSHFDGICLLLLAPAPNPANVSCGLIKCGISGHLVREDVSFISAAATTLLQGGYWFSDCIWGHMQSLMSKVSAQESLLATRKCTTREERFLVY